MNSLIYLAVIWACVFASTYLAAKTNLTSVLYFLAFGFVLGNIGVLPSVPTPFIQGFSDLAIILIMFALGFEEDSSNFVQSIKKSWGIALFGAIAPFYSAYYLSLQFWADTNIAIMCGLAMTATAVSLTMVSLKSEGLHNSRAATGIMTSAVLDDIASLALVAILVPLASGTDFTVQSVVIVLLKTVLFFAIVTYLGVWLFPKLPGPCFLKSDPILKKISNTLRTYGARDILCYNQGKDATLTVLLLGLLIGLLSHGFGFHPAIGAYMAGLILKEEYFDLRIDKISDCYKETKHVIDNVAFSWIGPVFFVTLGSQVIFEADILLSIIPETIILTLALFVAQVLSAGLAARFTAGMQWHESIMVGFGMLGRAELAFVVMNIGYIQNSILSQEAFYTLMGTAFFLNIAVPIAIRLWKPYFIGDKTLSFRIGMLAISLSNTKIQESGKSIDTNRLKQSSE